ncbi:MAG: protein kinase [Anaerolineales bacterium]|nr:protein kinase [Anaerolineales bacterium]
MTSFVGRTINNRYRLESLLGDGGMGTVYRAHDLNLDRAVAIKLMHPHFARQEEFRQRLVQEAKTAAQMDHPSVVRIYDFGESDAGLFIAMEYVDGGSLRDHLQRLQRLQKFLPLAQSLQIAAQIAEALQYAHGRGIIHRDVKPGNIILKRIPQTDEPEEQPFRAVLTDFGLVKLQEGSGITQSGTTLGTPMYMSPEQCEGARIDGRSDIYGLGVVLYELVTNKLPFEFQNLSEAISVHSQGTMPTPPSQLRGDVPRFIDAIINKAMAKEPAERYSSGGVMASALRSAIVSLEGAPTRVMSRQEINILDQVSEPPPGYELHIQTPNQPVKVVQLREPVVTLGRNPDNVIVLPTEGVSRHHARLQATSLGWEVVDLGGVNGTWLDDRRLRIETPAPIGPGSRLRIGPYELLLVGPEVAEFPPPSGPLVPGRITPGYTPQPTPAPTQTNATPAPPPPLGLFLPRDRVPVEPGQPVTLKVEVVNRGARDDRVSVQVQGLPGAWVETANEFVNVPAGETVQIGVTIRPPRSRGTPTGRQRFRVELVSQQHPDLAVGETASLLIGGFVAFDASLNTPEVQLPATLLVSVRNTGNDAGDFSIVARDRHEGLRFQGERGRIRLEPGQVANVELDVEARSQRLMGGGELFPFEIIVRSGGGAQQVLTGEAYSRNLVSPFLVYATIFVMTLACVVLVMALIVNRDRFFGGAVADTTITPALDLTGTAVALTVNASLAGTATVTPTLSAANDRDGDGLSDSMETDILRTDPDNPDSDGDRLTDYEEAIVIGSDPLETDSDSDILNDWDEVNVYRTSPIKADTDGDGIPDGLEVAQGSNPLLPDVPTLSPTPTATVATTTPSPSPTVGPSATPSITPSPTPSLTPSMTPSPTPSLTPSMTPSATPSETPSATPTWTPIPNPVLACVDTPPSIDGVFNVTEWPNAPLLQFAPDGQPQLLVQVYGSRSGANLYLVFLINDSTTDVTDSVRVLFDVTNNNGDPDSADRYFQIGRDDTTAVSAGIGSNSDTQNWNSAYTTDNWQAVISGQNAAQWTVEVQIDAAAEMGALTDTFGMMVQVLYTGQIASWPATASSIDLNTWQDVDGAACP